MDFYRLGVDVPPDTLGALELTSIATGYLATDRMLKKAPIRILDAGAYCPGKFLILFTGDLASVEEALAIGVDATGTSLFDSILIPNLIPAVVHAINRTVDIRMKDTIGVLESFSAVALIKAVNEALKAVEITVESVNLLNGLGGKAFAVFTGELSDIQSALEVGRRLIGDDMFVAASIIPQVSGELLPFLPGRDRHVLG